MYPSNKNVEPVKSSSKIGKGLKGGRYELDLARSRCCMAIIRDKLSPVSVTSPVQPCLRRSNSREKISHHATN